MQVTIIYVISYASALGLLLLWRLCQFLTAQAREHVFSKVSRWVVHTVILPRFNGSSDVTILVGLIIALLFVANIIGSVLSIRNRAEASLRLARLCATNLVFLYLGGRSNIMLDRIFRLSHTEQNVLHRWIGRVTIAEGLIHGTLGIIELKAMIRPKDLSLYVLVGLIAVVSIVCIRRRMYEIFLQTHSLFAVASLILLWMHVRLLDTYLIVCLSTAASLYLLQKVSWLLYFLYQNFGSGPPCQASISRTLHSGRGEEVLQVRIATKKRWVVTPGQFVYLTLPHLRSLGLGMLESHPFMIAWATVDQEGKATSIMLLVQSCRGFTRRLHLANTLTPALIDGPYGGAGLNSFNNYDKVLLMSSGIGIAGHLSTARYLLLAHDLRTARVRRLTMTWLLETQDQMRWAEEFLCALVDMDDRQILTIFCYYPNQTDGSAEGHVSSFETPRKRIIPRDDTLSMAWLIEHEWCAEAGNMLVGVCGSPQFELRARQAVKSLPYDIDLKNSVFQPDETQASKLSGFRYCKGSGEGKGMEKIIDHVKANENV
ncbi:uncharacterized protein K460DRAFT_296976 [Cucurbitaria berberidis CBS 394.84]|uniref:FAD-binding FR-type domain-containing protein n=1 Tax=Cucurbitaria berberidis CBS 394.84 TaxID=1168544 RepID=A0A9P4L3S9_9PLEO|nr:uncharacterized protein K460DRAFT_296976 [Cucurbitaria berberidis CBS 394.84]KAF1840098.1 hypothetical protein K460DRAFT_296976 [Cucurbitaria berberidis CBS 394.84]